MPAEIANLSNLLSQLHGLIQSARRQAMRAVDTLQVRTCWEIGRHVVEYEQQGADRAAYGARLIVTLAESLTAEFGRGFDERNLRHMRGFFQGFPIWNAVRTELSWIHYRTLLRVEDEQARLWHRRQYGIVLCYYVCLCKQRNIAMRTTLALDDALIAKAQAFTGLTEKSALVREALKALIERESARRLALLGGSEPTLEPVPRRQSEQV